jgi:hypothetical protein
VEGAVMMCVSPFLILVFGDTAVFIRYNQYDVIGHVKTIARYRGVWCHQRVTNQAHTHDHFVPAEVDHVFQQSVRCAENSAAWRP